MHVRVQREEMLGGGLHLEPADIRRGMQDLTLEIGDIYLVKVRHAQSAYACRRQIKCRRGTQAPCPNAKDSAGPNFLLAVDPHFGQHGLARVAQELLLV